MSCNEGYNTRNKGSRREPLFRGRSSRPRGRGRSVPPANFTDPGVGHVTVGTSSARFRDNSVPPRFQNFPTMDQISIHTASSMHSVHSPGERNVDNSIPNVFEHRNVQHLTPHIAVQNGDQREFPSYVLPGTPLVNDQLPSGLLSDILQGMSDLRVTFQQELSSIRSDLPNLVRAEVFQVSQPVFRPSQNFSPMSNNIKASAYQNVVLNSEPSRPPVSDQVGSNAPMIPFSHYFPLFDQNANASSHTNFIPPSSLSAQNQSSMPIPNQGSLLNSVPSEIYHSSIPRTETKVFDFRPKISDLSAYNGDNEQLNPKEFISSLDDYFLDFRVSEKTKLAQTRKLLTGPAQTWFWATQFVDFSDFKTKFLRHFWGEEIQSTVRQSLNIPDQYKQEHGSMTNYFLKKLRVARCLDTPIPDKELIRTIVSHFGYQVKWAITHCNASTIDTVIEKLTELDQLNLNRFTNTKRTNQQPSSANHNTQNAQSKNFVPNQVKVNQVSVDVSQPPPNFELSEENDLN